MANRPANKIPDSLAAKIAEMAVAGHSVKQIVAATGAKHGTVVRYAQKACKATGMPGVARVANGAATLKKLESALRKGRGTRRAARDLGLSEQYVRKISAKVFRSLNMRGVRCKCGAPIGHTGVCQDQPTSLNTACKDPLFAKLLTSVSAGKYRDVRDDVVQQAYLIILETSTEIKTAVKQALSVINRGATCGRKIVSLDTTTVNGFSLYSVIAETLQDENAYRTDP